MSAALLVRGPLAAAVLAAAFSLTAGAGEEPADKPSRFALEEALKDSPRPPRSGVVLETPKAEVVEKDGKKVLRVEWRIRYAGPRWPLVILAPSLTRPSFRGTKLHVIAKGKSGEEYVTDLANPDWGPFNTNRKSEKEWFVNIPKEKGTGDGVLDADLTEVKRRLLKYYPDEFDPKTAPELYVRLEHDVVERGDDVGLDAWTGSLIATPVKVASPKW